MADDRVTAAVSFPGAGGDPVNAFTAAPTGGGALPAVIVVHGATGVSEDIMQHAGRLASDGFLAVVPDLYSRVPSPDLSSLESAMRLLGTMSDDQVAGDLEGAATFAKADPRCSGRVGAIGFGGRYAYLFASRSHSLEAVVACYGPMMRTEIDTPELRPLAPIDMVPDFGCPFLGIFGEADRNPSPEHVEQFERMLKRHGKTYALRTYPNGGHGFLSPGGRNYDPAAAQSAWPDMLTWLHGRLD